MLETDVRMTKDRELVIMHDPTVDRTTDGTGLVHEMTLAQLKALDAAADFGSFPQEAPPTLEEFLKLCARCDKHAHRLRAEGISRGGQQAVAYECADRTIRCSRSTASASGACSTASMESCWSRIDRTDNAPRSSEEGVRNLDSAIENGYTVVIIFLISIIKYKEHEWNAALRGAVSCVCANSPATGSLSKKQTRRIRPR